MTKDKHKLPGAEIEPIVSVEKLFETLRHSGLPLNEQLNRISAAMEKSHPRYAQAYDQLVARLNHSGTGENAPKKGERMPDFLLPDENGKLIRLQKLLDDGPVVVAFLRGHWCPYCRLNAIGLAGIEDAILPTQIVAISAETGKFARTLRAESGAQFPFLTDVGNGYALSLGLAFWLGADLEKMLYADSCDIPAYHGTQGWFLPIPAVFIVGQDGFVTERYVNGDFRQRLEIRALRAAALAASTGDR